jgi:hypothetical protein
MKKQLLKWIVMGLLVGSSSEALAAWGAFYLAGAAQYSSYYIDRIKFEGISPRLALGYGGMANSIIYVAGELFGMPFTSTLNNNSRMESGLKTSYSFGASFLPGYYFDENVMGYLRLSYIATRFVKVPTTKAGYETGLGVDVCWSPNWHAYFEYDYAKYRTINDMGTPKSGSYVLGVKYFFV